MKEINLNRLFDEYDLNREDRIILLDIITPIINHPEFKKRIDSNIYPHHHKISLGEHILDDAIVSYKIAKKKLQKNKNINIRLVVLTAMFHDLYELPWQNSQIKKNQVRNRHGFRHPIEAAINAIIWFPEYFENPNYEFTKITDKEEIANILNTYYDKYLDLSDKDIWFTKVKEMCDSLGYASNIKEYKKNPDAYKGNVSDVTGVIRISLTSKTNTPDLYEIMKLLGLDEIKERFTKCINHLK